MVNINSCKKKCNNTGLLKHKISIIQSTGSRNTGGGRPQTWTVFANVWAEIKPKHRNENLEAENLEQQTSHKITIRFRNDFDFSSALKKYRIQFETRFFRIQSAIDINEGKRFIELQCLEGKKNDVLVT
jgi:SPP1 family predicted phage head-tail adaptor